ncbi:MAG TPA: SagB/ThcOx family dehydrogenase [bacterium]
MKQRWTAFQICLLVVISSSIFAQELKPILLPTPQMQGGMPLMQALKNRRSQRRFSSEKLPLQTLSNLLWAANGINRPELKKRTAPSARNAQEIDVYVVMEEGVYRYDAVSNLLQPILKGDHRAATGTQPFVKNAPVNLVFVADWTKIPVASEEEKKVYAATDVGYISQNVYLFCASEELATVARGMVDGVSLATRMGLPPDQRVILTQTVGHPEKPQ